MATIKDIAEQLNISDATVSRAITGRGYVRAELKEQIFATAKQLKYIPNSLAVGLRTRKTKVILLVVPNISNPIYTDLVKYIERFATQDGYGVVLCNTDESIAKEKLHLQMLVSGMVSGVILVPCIRLSENKEYLQAYPANKIVLFNRSIGLENFALVGADHHQGVLLAMEQFVKLGHKRVAALIGDLRTTVGRQRHEAYRDAVARFGLIDDPSILKLGKSSEEDGYRLTRQLLQAKSRPQALLVCHNELTKGCIRACQEKGIKVPNELAIITIDDLSNGAIIQPHMTYVKQPLEAMSQKAYDLLIANLEEQETAARQVLYPVELVIRESCGTKR